MFLKSISVVNFRNYDNLELELSPNVNIIYGDNAQGKTNLLESIYFLAMTKSHRSFIDDNLIREGEKIAKIDGLVSNDDFETNLRIVLSTASKKMFVDGNNYKKVSDYVSRMNVIIFYPEDLELVKGGPLVRRRYINLELSQLYSNYMDILNDYKKLIKIKGNYLKGVKSGNKMDDNYYSINIGDTLPLEFATKGGTATTNYFGGPTRNYDELKIEYDEYKCGTYYITNLEDIDDSCQLNQKVSFKPKAFNGVTLEKNTNTVEKLYTCTKYKNDIYCYESATNRTFDDMYAIYDDVVSIFGEYDSTTELGCSKINENRLDRFSIDCYYIDGDDNISLTVRSNNAVLNVDGISSNISYSVGNGLGGPEHIEQY